MLAEIWSFLIGPIYSTIASTASLVGLGVTIWVLINVRNIRNSYIFAIRVPDLLKQLKTHTKKLSEHMNDFDGLYNQIRLEIALIEEVLRSLRGKLDRRARTSVDALLKLIKAYDWKARDKNALDEIYIELKKLETRIDYLRQDSEVER